MRLINAMNCNDISIDLTAVVAITGDAGLSLEFR